jgi:hypothetical protein
VRTRGELEALAIRRYSGNWGLDSKGILYEEMDEYEHAWKAEAARRFELTERGRKALDKN